MPSFVSAGSQLQENSSSGVTVVPGERRTGGRVALASPAVQLSDASRSLCGTESGGPGRSSGANSCAEAAAGTASASAPTAAISPLLTGLNLPIGPRGLAGRLVDPWRRATDI